MNYGVRNYILDDAGQPVPEPDPMKWSQWFEQSWPARQVARTDLDNDVYVSTVFLGLDHQYHDINAPILFETMIFGGEHDQSQWRYHFREQAAAAHERIVATMREGGDPNHLDL